MKKRYILSCLLAILALLNGYTQNPNNKALNATFKNTLTYQLLNDFNTEIPIFVITPGFFMIGSINYYNFPVFVDVDHFDDLSLLKQSNYLQKEIYDALNFPFLPHVPSDSITVIRIIDKNRLLYTLKIEPDGEKLHFTQTTADGQQEKRIEFDNGKISQIYFVNSEGISWLTYEQSGDSLFVKEEYDNDKNTLTKDIIKLKDGKILSKHHHIRKDGHSDYRLQSHDKYFYESDRLISIEHLNRRGNLRQSSHMIYYESGDLLKFRKTNRRGTILELNYLLDDKGLLNRKTVESKRRSYTVNYRYEEDFLNKIMIQEEGKRFQHIIEAGWDVNNLLNNMTIGKNYKSAEIPDRNNKYVFSYTNKHNIESIRLFDPKGKISKEIYFEYSFLPN